MISVLPRAEIYVVEQMGDKPFNRAALLNCGAGFAVSDFFVCHDVDHLPKRVDYTPTFGVTQLARNEIQKRDFVGAATMFDMETFIKIGGYNADYFCRGEDNELFFHLQRNKIKIKFKPGLFDVLPHERPWKEFDAEIWNRSQQPRTKNYLDRQYVVQSQQKELYTHLKVVL